MIYTQVLSVFLDRIEEVAFSFNGGKDSTVSFQGIFLLDLFIVLCLIDSSNNLFV